MRTLFPIDVIINLFRLLWICHILFLLLEVCDAVSAAEAPPGNIPQTCTLLMATSQGRLLKAEGRHRLCD